MLQFGYQTLLVAILRLACAVAPSSIYISLFPLLMALQAQEGFNSVHGEL